MNIMRCQSLAKTFSSGESAVYAVLDVTLALHQGEFVAITGPSGSGKSTLLHMLGGLETPTSGKVFYQDTDLHSYNDNQLSVIARALSNKPSILFADEPTGNLDGKTGREVLSLMRYMGKELGITLVLVTHDLNIAEQADRVLTLEDGQIVRDTAEGCAPSEVITDE